MAYMIPMFFYEVPLGLWFLIKGVKAPVVGASSLRGLRRPRHVFSSPDRRSKVASRTLQTSADDRFRAGAITLAGDGSRISKRTTPSRQRTSPAGSTSRGADSA